MSENNNRKTNDNIVKIENNQFDNYLKIHCKNDPTGKISNIMRYLKCNGWENFKFNQYKIDTNNNDYIIKIDYIMPKLFGKK